jgi:hypothetical protein
VNHDKLQGDEAGDVVVVVMVVAGAVTTITGGRTGRQPSNQQAGRGMRELYDPGYAPKPGFNIQKRVEPAGQPGNQPGTPREEDQIIRAPRGPDGSGRGGFGFARRRGEHG